MVWRVVTRSDGLLLLWAIVAKVCHGVKIRVRFVGYG